MRYTKTLTTLTMTIAMTLCSLTCYAAPADVPDDVAKEARVEQQGTTVEEVQDLGEILVVGALDKPSVTFHIGRATVEYEAPLYSAGLPTAKTITSTVSGNPF